MFGFAWLLCNSAVGDNKETSKQKPETGLAATTQSKRALSTQQTSLLTAPSVGDIGLDRVGTFRTTPSIPSQLPPTNRTQFEKSDFAFEDKKQQRQYEDVLKKLRSMKPSSGGDASKDDWFVVGGVVCNQANFDAFQGEEDVARRVVEFVVETNNRCQWKIFSREQDSYIAEEMVGKVQSKYEQWKQGQINRMIAAQRARQRAASSNRRRISFSSGRSRSC